MFYAQLHTFKTKQEHYFENGSTFRTRVFKNKYIKNSYVAIVVLHLYFITSFKYFAKNTFQAGFLIKIRKS